jgi:hypothetical protein
MRSQIWLLALNPTAHNEVLSSVPFWEYSQTAPSERLRQLHYISFPIDLFFTVTLPLSAVDIGPNAVKSVFKPIPVPTPSKARVCRHLRAGIVGSNPAGAWMSVSFVVCCQVEVSASGWSLVQRSPTECGVSECDREASIMRRPWPTRGCCARWGKNVKLSKSINDGM